jgi:hypothetical protein
VLVVCGPFLVDAQPRSGTSSAGLFYEESDTPMMALKNDTSGAAALRQIVMDNTKLWTYRANPVHVLDPAGLFFGMYRPKP